MLIKVDAKEVVQHLPDDVSLILAFASFEARCTSLSRQVAEGFIGEAILLCNKPTLPETVTHLATLQKVFHGRADVIDVRIDSPVITIDQFSSKVLPRIIGAKGRVLVDITTFTHEHLLILVYLLKRDGMLGKVIFTYTGAEQYSPSGEVKEIWLSKGVKQIRSVLGFPGELVPSKDLHLIIQVGFELERAQKIIESYEPRRLSLGFAPGLMSVTPELAETNREFFVSLLKFVEETRSNTTTVDHFEFSCVDPLAAKKSLLTQVEKNPGFNTIVCPLNTKVSTLGAALLGFEIPSIQLCYAEPSIYNSSNYSTPGPSITIFDSVALGVETA